jgi:hypothetical protein
LEAIRLGSWEDRRLGGYEAIRPGSLEAIRLRFKKTERQVLSPQLSASILFDYPTN